MQNIYKMLEEKLEQEEILQESESEETRKEEIEETYKEEREETYKEEREEQEKPTTTKIKHIVIPGGGPTGIIALGALKYLEEQNFWKIEDIESIYATSAGTFLALLISMKFEWSMITDYIIKRPWQEAIKITPNMFFDAYSKKGLFDRSIIEIFFKPFFNIKDWSLEITMNEIYLITKKELHFFSLDANSFEVIDINYKTFPDLPVLTAIQMSSAIPGIICPVFINGKCYIDGGVVCNYPIKNCLDNVEDPDSVFSIKNNYSMSGEDAIKEESTILEYIVDFIVNMVFSVGPRAMPQPNNIKNEIKFDLFPMRIYDLKEMLDDQKKREELFETGLEGAKKYLDCKN
jgi:predicted acylesterase/phospholipase RssA